MISSFYSVELTSRCNLKCHYCPQPRMERAKLDMSEETFERVLYWLGRFAQDEIHLHNFGESTLHPNVVDCVRRVAELVPRVGISTNGVGVTEQLVKDLFGAGLSKLSVSTHRPEKAQWVVSYCKANNFPYDIAMGPMDGTHNWAGQVDSPITLPIQFDCFFLRHQRCVVLADGRLAACCIDAEGKSAQGSVFEDLTQLSFEPFPLCLTCHHRVPDELYPGWKEKLTNAAKQE